MENPIEKKNESPATLVGKQLKKLLPNYGKTKKVFVDEKKTISFLVSYFSPYSPDVKIEMEKALRKNFDGNKDDLNKDQLLKLKEVFAKKCIHGWSGFKDSHGEVTFSKEAALEIFIDPECSEITDKVLNEACDKKYFCGDEVYAIEVGKS